MGNDTETGSVGSSSSSYMHRYKKLTKLSEGSFGKVYMGLDTMTNQPVAIKVENSKNASHAQLRDENKIYKSFHGVYINKLTAWPKVHEFGKLPNGEYIMIMDLLGPNVDMLFKSSREPFSSASIAYLADKMITLIHIFHRKGYVHRDLKPQNITLQNIPKGSRIPIYPEFFLIDYGLAKRFAIPETNSHAEYCDNKALKGTVRYISINTHLGVDQSRRDDMQSIGYILVYLALGRLPWQNVLRSQDRQEGYKKVMMLKMSNTFEDITEGIPEPLRTCLLEYLFYVNSLMYHEEPNYEFAKSIFKDLKSTYNGELLRNRKTTIQ